MVLFFIMAKRYYDLNVPFAEDLTETTKKVERLIKFGYHVIALNKLYVPTNKRKRGGKKLVDGDNGELNFDHKGVAEKISSMLTEKPMDFKILTRITVIVDNPDQVRCFQQEYIRSFDIIAIRPTNDKMFLQACMQMEHIDVISLDTDYKIPFKIKYSMVGAAIERGVFIELSYASAIRSSSLRRNVLANAVNLVKYCQGKGIILTSNGEHFMEIRAPKDVINLASMFGMKGSQANDTVCNSCRGVVLHAYARSQTAKSVITMRKVGAPASDMEKIVKEEISKEKDDNDYSEHVLVAKKAKEL